MVPLAIMRWYHLPFLLSFQEMLRANFQSLELSVNHSLWQECFFCGITTSEFAAKYLMGSLGSLESLLWTLLNTPNHQIKTEAKLFFQGRLSGTKYGSCVISKGRSGAKRTLTRSPRTRLSCKQVIQY